MLAAMNTGVSVWTFLASATIIPIVLPLVLILVPKWRHPFRLMWKLAAAMETLMFLLCYQIYLLFGSTVFSIWLVGLLPPLLCAWAFLYFCQLKDGRLFFIIATIGLDMIICDSLTSLLVSRDTPLWLVLKIIITLAQSFFIWKFGRKPFLEMLENNQIRWGQIALIPFTLWMSMLGYYLASHAKEPVFPTLVLSCGAVLVYIILYRFQKALLEQAEARQYTALLRSEVGHLERQAHQAETTAQNVKILRHDLRHYTRMLQGCLETGDMESAKNIVAALEQNTQSLTDLNVLTSYTGNPILDTVLSQAAEQAKQRDIQFTVRLELPEPLKVDATELSVVISNALENALRAASKEPGTKQVSILSKPTGSQFFLIISNSFSGTLELDEKTGLPITHAAGHGYGTRSISSFAEKYDCVLDCGVHDGSFHLRLLI